MTISQLRKRLSKLPGDAQVVAYNDHQDTFDPVTQARVRWIAEATDLDALTGLTMILFSTTKGPP